MQWAFKGQLRVPSLLLYGSADQRVPSAESARRITEAARIKPQVIVFPGADHTSRLKPANVHGFSWPENAPGYPDRVIEWALGVGAVKSPP